MTVLPQPDGVFDGVITFNTIYYIAELEQALAELARVLASTGRAIVGLADPDAMATRSFSQHGMWLRPVPTVIALAEQAGLVLDQHLQRDLGGETVHLLVLQAPPQPPDSSSGR